MAARQSARLLSRQLTSQCSHSQPQARRMFSNGPAFLAAQNFTMPAMSPTMTEGNISSWKVKEGDTFAAGDILLEIETDKASMDVEAQEDGIVAKIFSSDGSKGVQVGTRIAVLAEPGDDISSLDIPPDDSKPVKKAADNVKGGEDSSYETSGVEKDVKGTPENKRPAKDKPKTSPTGPGQNPKYPLYPSVIALIHENHLSDEDVAKIAATGPNNRVLKGDVLAYLGSVDQEYPAKQSQRINHLGHLDLSNIKIQAPAAKLPAAAPAAAASAADSGVPKVTSIALSISLSEVLKVQKRIKDTLGLSVPLSTFLARAVDLANDDLPLPKGTKPSADDLFNAVLGLDTIPTSSRASYLPQIDAFSISAAPPIPRPVFTKSPDIIDILSGKAVRRTAAPLSSSRPTPGKNITTTDGAVNVFSLTVPISEEKRARTFLERVKTVLQVEPGRLVL